MCVCLVMGYCDFSQPSSRLLSSLLSHHPHFVCLSCSSASTSVAVPSFVCIRGSTTIWDLVFWYGTSQCLDDPLLMLLPAASFRLGGLRSVAALPIMLLRLHFLCSTCVVRFAHTFRAAGNWQNSACQGCCNRVRPELFVCQRPGITEHVYR